MKYTAKDWAEWSSASNVLQILESWEQADAAGPDEHMSSDGQDATEDSDTLTSNDLFQDATDFSFWRNAMSENWKVTQEWCDVRSIIVPMAIALVNPADSPERMYHWGLRQYLQFAFLCGDSAGKNTAWKRLRALCGKGSKIKFAGRFSLSKLFMTMEIFSTLH